LQKYSNSHSVVKPNSFLTEFSAESKHLKFPQRNLFPHYLCPPALDGKINHKRKAIQKWVAERTITVLWLWAGEGINELAIGQAEFFLRIRSPYTLSSPHIDPLGYFPETQYEALLQGLWNELIYLAQSELYS
jgi:hypothetical protein